MGRNLGAYLSTSKAHTMSSVYYRPQSRGSTIKRKKKESVNFDSPIQTKNVLILRIKKAKEVFWLPLLPLTTSPNCPFTAESPQQTNPHIKNKNDRKMRRKLMQERWQLFQNVFRAFSNEAAPEISEKTEWKLCQYQMTLLMRKI